MTATRPSSSAAPASSPTSLAPASPNSVIEATARAVARSRGRRNARRRLLMLVLVTLILFVFVVSLMVGQTFYGLDQVIAVVLGQDVQGATFTVGRLRLPRAVLAVLAGLAFGLAGVTFQTMLRNPLASPDIIGISSGASAAAAFGIVTLSLGASEVSFFAIFVGLGVAILIYVLSFKGGVTGTRLILIGIGIAAMLDSITNYVLSQAAQWDLQEALRWLNGSLNGASWNAILPVAISILVLVPILLAQSRSLSATQLGDDTAAALGVRVNRTRLVVIITAVGVLSFATAAAGPIAFVAFLAGPIAARLFGGGGSLLIPAGLVGALLVLVADLVGQFLLGTRYPVGVVTGVLGAPFLIYLIIRTNRAGGSL
ncbi:FecCD family ABC transporter permease [Pseudoclavibacter sp. VKM Ac-2867]|uniref:FecCD family ABC transporter permease n=1 Tax=Pseudoclavibacter sp. VKM Ac-2867 TaxID=2783829 RepID=UPI00188C2F79|nr:iron chelate uptake ABC transporter family permease subunit [Pseudoclavibacter sp. VKM Ac-2867]MBF4459109.1 iron chelate uptake ABC transporter family permease subunit [Pseudoclavibacter sp. VKM Ac-2867]